LFSEGLYHFALLLYSVAPLALPFSDPAKQVEALSKAEKSAIPERKMLRDFLREAGS